MRIFLTGMPGSGKSYWKEQLATLLQYSAADTDQLVEAKTGKKIPELFAEGEILFREKEREALLELIQQYPGKVVIATGGGAPCYKDNMELMKAAGCVLYLETSIERLISNVEGQGPTRPLLANGSRKELADKLSALYRNRKEIYEQAQVKIDAETATLSTFAAAIEKYLSDNNLSL